MSGKGHPLPASEEARHDEIPEHLARAKGRGDDSRDAVQPGPEAVNPDGEPYRYDDLGRGTDSVGRDDEEEFEEDQAAHQDRGQSAADAETGVD